MKPRYLTLRLQSTVRASGLKFIRPEARTLSFLVRLFDQPDFRDFAAAAISAGSWLLRPVQREFARTRARRRKREFQALEWFAEERMNFRHLIRRETNFRRTPFASVYDADFVSRRGIDSGVAQLQRPIIKRLGPVPP